MFRTCCLCPLQPRSPQMLYMRQRYKDAIKCWINIQANRKFLWKLKCSFPHPPVNIECLSTLLLQCPVPTVCNSTGLICICCWQFKIVKIRLYSIFSCDAGWAVLPVWDTINWAWGWQEKQWKRKVLRHSTTGDGPKTADWVIADLHIYSPRSATYMFFVDACSTNRYRLV